MGRCAKSPGALLNYRQEKFAIEYAKSLNAEKAMKKAGYTPAQPSCRASELLSNPRVRNRVEVILKKDAEKVEIDREYIMRRLKRWADVDEVQYAPVSLKALELISKMIGVDPENRPADLHYTQREWLSMVKKEAEKDKQLEIEYVEVDEK